MTVKELPFSKEDLERIISTYPTPFHLYDERGIRTYARKFLSAFSWNPGFMEYYAIKAAPNPYLMKILKEEGFGIDCSSLAELELAGRLGFRSPATIPRLRSLSAPGSWEPLSTSTIFPILITWKSMRACPIRSVSVITPGNSRKAM